MKEININNLLQFYQKISIYLLYLVPITLVTGPFLSDLSISLIGLFFLIISLKNKLFSYYKNYFVYIFAFFYLYLLLRSFFSENILYSLQGCIFYFRYLFFSLGVFYLFNNVKNLARNLGLCIFFTLIIVGLDGYYQWFFGENIFGWKLDNPDRLASFFKEEKILGGYLARLTPICIALLIYSLKLNKIKICCGVLFLIYIDVLIFGSGERSAVLFLFILSFVIITLSNNFKILGIAKSFISISIIALIIVYVPASNQKVKDTLNQVSSNKLYSFAPYSPLHEEHYIVGLKMFEDNILFGQAPNMFDLLCEKTEFNYKRGCTNHPHNNYIQLLAETGIIGFAFLFFVFVLVSFILFKQFLGKVKMLIYNLPDYLIFLLTAVFIFTWPFIPTGSFFNNWTNVMYYLPIGFILNYFYKDKI